MPLQGIVYNKAEISLVFLKRGISAIDELASQSPQVHRLLYYHGVSRIIFD